MKLAVLAALVLGALVAQFAIAEGGGERGPDRARIAQLEREVDALRADVAGAEAAKKKKKKVKRGPAGPQGPQGPPGAAGSPAGGMLFGWIEPADLPAPGGSRDYSPLGSGDAGINVGAIPVSPNSTVVVRDLMVKAISPPGLGARWDFTLQGDSASQLLTCRITGVAATTCNSGGQAVAIPPGGGIRLIVNDSGMLPSAPTNLYYAYRVGGP